MAEATKSEHPRKGLWKLKSRWVGFTLVLLIVGTCWEIAEHIAFERTRMAQRERVTNELALVRAKLESAILEELARVQGVGAYISAYPDLTQQDFETIAEQMVQPGGRIHNIAAARDLVITHMYPIDGNEKAIGLVYHDNAEQWPAIQKAIENRTLLLAGPVNLVQGGKAFIARQPIYHTADGGNEQLWGIVATVISYQSLVSAIVLPDHADFAIALRGNDGSGAEGDVFYGDASIFASSHMSMTIVLPYGSWEMAAGLIHPATPPPTILLLMKVSALIFAALGLAGVHLWFKAERATWENNQILTASERKYRVFFEGTGEAICLIDPSTRLIVDLNAKAAEQLGYTREDLVGKPLAVIEPALDQGGPSEEAQSIEVPQRETLYQTKAGTLIPVSVVCSRVNFGEGEQLLTAARDITQRKEYEAELEAARLEAVQASHTKSSFLANMSHEIRTPLNGVLGMTEILLGEEPSNTQRRKLEVIQESGTLLLTVLNDILDIAKIEAGRMALENIAFDLKGIVHETCDFVRFDAERKDLDLKVITAGLEDRFLVGDPARLKQILLNLLSNAIKFTHQGHVSLKVTQTPHDNGQVEVVFTVEDTGVGIEEGQQQAIFSEFTQADNSMTRKFGGSGLGLAIVRKLLALMHGEIEVRSSVGVGTTFRVAIPFTVAEDQTATSDRRQAS